MKYFRISLLFNIFLPVTACSNGADTAPTPTISTEQTTMETYISPANIRANGILRLIQQMELSFGVGGFIETVESSAGESVSAGQALVHLDTEEAALALQQAAISAANLGLIAGEQILATIHTNADKTDAQALQTLPRYKKSI